MKEEPQERNTNSTKASKEKFIRAAKVLVAMDTGELSFKEGTTEEAVTPAGKKFNIAEFCERIGRNGDHLPIWFNALELQEIYNNLMEGRGHDKLPEEKQLSIILSYCLRNTIENLILKEVKQGDMTALITKITAVNEAGEGETDEFVRAMQDLRRTLSSIGHMPLLKQGQRLEKYMEQAPIAKEFLDTIEKTNLIRSASSA